MTDWEWESFDSFINGGYFSVTQAGPLHAPIHSFSIKRGETLQLVLETVAAHNAQANAPIHPLGTVRRNTDTVELTHASGIKAVASGVEPRNPTRLINQETGIEALRQRSYIHSLEVVRKIAGEATYTMDWLANVHSSYQWPDSINEDIETVTTITISTNTNGPVLRDYKKTSDIHNNCVKICVDGLDVYLGASLSAKSENSIGHGFILYTGTPSEDVREKIRNCFSFSLGMYLIYFGHSTFNRDWHLTSFKAVSAYSPNQKVFDFPVPPACIGSTGLTDINQNSLSRMVNALYSNYDDLHFGRLSWMYWHARYAPIHAAAVQFGAAIEALQVAYVQKHKLSITRQKHTLSIRKLLTKTEWKNLKRKFGETISELAIDEDTKERLLNKAGGLNQAPQNTVAERLFDALKLKLGPLEKQHGSKETTRGMAIQLRTEIIVSLSEM